MGAGVLVVLLSVERVVVADVLLKVGFAVLELFMMF